MALVLQTGRLGRGQPSMAQIGPHLVIVDGINRNMALSDGRTLLPLSLEQPRILIHGENIAADYHKDDATYKYYIQLDDDAVFEDDRVIGATITLADQNNADGKLIIDSWKSYPSAPYAGKPVVKIGAALAYDFDKNETTYKIHRKFKLQAGTGGSVDEGDHMYLVSALDKSRDFESATPEIPENDDYGDLEFYVVTVSSPNNKVTIQQLFKPADDEATHWRVYGTEAGSDIWYHIGDYEIGTWDSSETITITQSDAWLRARPKREMQHHPFPTSSVVCVAMNRAFLGGTEVIRSPGTLSLSAGERYFEISGGALTKQMEGLRFQVEGGSTAYEIRTVLDEEHGILYEEALTSESGVAYRIFGWERTMFPSEIDPNTGKAHPEGTRLYKDALELPIARGGRIVVAGRLPGEDIGVYSEEESVRITGRTTLDAVQNFEEGIVSKPSLVISGGFTAGLNNKGIVASSYGSLPRLLSAKVPRQFSDEEINRLHNWRVPGGCFTAEGGTPWAVWFLAPEGEDTLDIGMLVNLATEEWTSLRGIAATAFGVLTDSDGRPWPVVGTAFGMLLWFLRAQSSTNNSMGARSTRRRGIADATSTGTQLVDPNASFETSGSGERGVPVWLIAGTGVGQMRYVYSNTLTTLVPHKAFDPVPDATTVYQLGAMRGRGKGSWSGLGYPAARLKDVLWLDFVFKGYDPLYGANGTKVEFIRGSDTVKATGSLVFSSDAIGQPILRENDFSSIGWIKSKNAAGTQLTLVSDWVGDTGIGGFTVGAPILKVNLRADMKADEIEKTIYVPMHVPVVAAKVGIGVSFLQIEFETFDEAPLEIWGIWPRFETV